MALIKCPECGKEVSTAATSCPHCGYPLKRTQGNHTQEIYPKPKNPSWVLAWKTKAKKTRWTWSLLFLSSIIGLTISLILMFNDRYKNSYSYMEMKPVHVVFSIIFGIVAIVFLAIWLLVLLTVKVRARQYDGYSVLVYVGFKSYLVVENSIQDSGFTNRYLYGQLPNKKQVWVSISAWDGSVKMGVGQAGDEKNLI